MTDGEIRLSIVAVDRVTAHLAQLAMRFRELRAITERTVFLLSNRIRRRPQGPRPKHHPRRRHGR